DPVPAGPRLADVPVPRSPASPRPATRPLARYRRGRTVRRPRGPAPAGRGPVRRPVPRLNQLERITMSEEPLLIDRAGGVVTLTLNRPDALNSFNVALKLALRDAIDAVAADPACRAVVLTGAGRSFCAGQDLKEHTEALAGDDAPLETVVRHFNPLVRTLAALPKPVVAAVVGTAAGAGASLAFLADFRIGGPRTTFLMAFANVGLAADTGASWTLPRLVGHARATEMLLLAEPVRAEEAHRIG